MAETVKYGLSEKGFKRKRLPEIIQSLNDRVSEKLGIQIQTGANSVFGQLHGVYAYELSDLWAATEDVYKAMYPSTAEGASLSNAAGLAGISLISAEKTTLIATCYGVDGTEIPYGAQISDGKYTYSCIDTYKTISTDTASYAAVTIEDEPAAGISYGMTIDGTTHTHTAAAGEDAAVILIDLYSQFSFTDRTSSVNNGVLSIRMNDESETMKISVTNMTIQQVGSPFSFACDTAGEIEPVLGKVTNIPLAYPGWAAVSNNVSAAVGRNAESDIDLRQRWSRGVYARGIAMTDSIAAAIYQNVKGVTACLCYENNTDMVDEEGRPPHSIEVVVDGGQPKDIGSEIWRTKAAGIDTYGSEAIEIYDSQDVPHTLNFSRPEQVEVWLRVEISQNPDEDLPAAAAQQIAKALLEKGQDQKIGQDVILQRYFATVFGATSGVGYIALTAKTRQSDPYSTNNISINARQVAVFSDDHIEVIVND